MAIDNHINFIFSSISYHTGRIIIDPGDRWCGFYNSDAVLLTHAHFDHIYGLNDVLTINPYVKVYTNAVGRMMLLNSKENLSAFHEKPFIFKYPNAICEVEDGQEIKIGDIVAKAIFTPGHNPSCITWLIGESLFSGDSLIPGVKTITNLPKSNRYQAIESENIIRMLSHDRQLYPGHKI